MSETLSPQLFQDPALRHRLIEIRRDLHRHPELGFQEERTAGRIQERLTELGIPFRAGLAGTGVLGSIEGALSGPTVLLRADMDALPVEEQGEHDYRSEHPGRMHACGHDAHVAILLGAAEVLQSLRGELPGRVQLCFQPAEEGPGGAAPMIAEGVLEDPRVDHALGLHVWVEIPRGQVALVPGPFMAAADTWECVLTARGGHGASPHLTPDPIVTAAHLIQAWQTVVSREVDPLQPSVLSVCSIHGGSADNIIPDRVTLTGTVRSFDDGVREAIPTAMRRILEGVSRAHGCESEFLWKPLYPATVNDPQVTQLLRETVQEMDGRLEIFHQAKPCMGAEDMSYFLRQVPGCYAFLGAARPGDPRPWPHHSPRFDIDEDCLPLGVELLVRGALRLLRGGTSPA